VGLAEGGRLETIGREMTRDELLTSLTWGVRPVWAGRGRLLHHYARGKNEQPYQRYLNFRSDRYTMGYDISDRNFADWWIEGGRRGLQHIDPSTLRLRRHEVRTDFVTDTDLNARLNLELPYTLADLRGTVRSGAGSSPRTRTVRPGSAATGFPRI
jgi:hypothetical protein